MRSSVAPPPATKGACTSAVSCANCQSARDHSEQCGIVDTTDHQRLVAAGHAGRRYPNAGPQTNGTSGTSVQSNACGCRVTACPGGFGLAPLTATTPDPRS